jgi:hypothetical protein
MSIQTFFSWTLIHNRQINLPLGIFLHYKNALALLQVVQGNAHSGANLRWLPCSTCNKASAFL